MFCILQGEYGIPKPWYFLFQSSYWCSSKGKPNVINSFEARAETGTGVYDFKILRLNMIYIFEH